MLDHWMLFQTHRGQCLGSGWQVLHPLSAPVPFPPLGKDALSASSLSGRIPVLIYFGCCCPSAGWCLLPLGFSPFSQLSSPSPSKSPGGTVHLCQTPSTRPLQF